MMRKSMYALSALCALELLSLPAMAAEVVETEAVQVTGSRLAKSMAEVAAPAYVVTREEIDKSAAATVQEVLNTIPGVNGLQNGAAMTQRQTVSIRGLQTEVLLLIDGMPYNDPSHGAGDFAYDLRSISLNDVERIEVVKGASSAIYGSHAAAGVINIITKKGAEKNNVIIGAEAGSDGWLKGTVRGTAVGKDGLKATVQYTRTQEDERRTRQRFKNGPFDRALEYRGNDYSLKLEKGFWNFTAQAGDYDSRYEYGGDLNKDKTNYRRFFIGYDDGVNSARLYFFKNERDYASFGSWPSATTYDNTSLGAIYNRRFQRPGFSGVWGVELKDEGSKVVDMYSAYDKNRTNLAPFVEFSIPVAEKGLFDLGLRYEYWDLGSETRNEILPRLSFNWQLDSGALIYATAGRHFAVPSLYELYSPYGKASMKPEYGWAYDVGIKNQTARNPWSVGLFYLDMNDKIAWDSALYTYNNISEYRAHGVEAQVKIPFGENWSYTQGVTYTYAEEKASAASDWARSGMPRWDLVGTFGYSSGPWSGEFEMHYYADRYLKSLSSDEYDDNFFLANLSLGWKDGDNKIGFAVRNIFDKEVFIDNSRYIAPERRFVVSYEHRF